MYKLLKHEEKEYPVRISNMVLGEWQELTGKQDLKKMSLMDAYHLLRLALKKGHQFAEREYKLRDMDVELMIDNQETFMNFMNLITEFFPASEKGGEPGKQKNLKKKQ